MRVTHKITVDYPVRVECYSDHEFEEYLKNAITNYNSHLGYPYFAYREDPEVIEVDKLDNDKLMEHFMLVEDAAALIANVVTEVQGQSRGMLESAMKKLGYESLIPQGR